MFPFWSQQGYHYSIVLPIEYTRQPCGYCINIYSARYLHQMSIEPTLLDHLTHISKPTHPHLNLYFHRVTQQSNKLLSHGGQNSKEIRTLDAIKKRRISIKWTLSLLQNQVTLHQHMSQQSPKDKLYLRKLYSGHPINYCTLQYY